MISNEIIMQYYNIICMKLGEHCLYGTHRCRGGGWLIDTKIAGFSMDRRSEGETLNLQEKSKLN